MIPPDYPRAATAYEVDCALQAKKAIAEGRNPNEPCYQIVGGLPCSKIKGHDGPCYCVFS